MYKGSCLCGKIQYVLKSKPLRVSHCHCSMCQKQHGAAFATYASLSESNLDYVSGQDDLMTYHSSNSVQRKFCKSCGSNIEWRDSKHHSDEVAIAIASLDTKFVFNDIEDIYLATKACWLK